MLISTHTLWHIIGKTTYEQTMKLGKRFFVIPGQNHGLSKFTSCLTLLGCHSGHFQPFTNGTTQNGLAIKNCRITPKLGLTICNRKPHLSDTLFEMVRFEKKIVKFVGMYVSPLKKWQLINLDSWSTKVWSKFYYISCE